MTPEKQVQNGIINYLKTLKDKGEPLYYERRQAGGFSYHMGIADLYAVYNGLHIEIEVKKLNGRTSTMQDKWAEKCQQLNILYICAKSVDEVKVFFENLKKKL